jgi:hypothetical protein
MAPWHCCLRQTYHGIIITRWHMSGACAQEALRPPIPEQGKLYAWYKQLEVAVLNEEAPDEDGSIVTAAVTQLPEHGIHAMYFAAPSAELCPHLRRTKFVQTA